MKPIAVDVSELRHTPELRAALGSLIVYWSRTR
jgi:hypothetical protein